MNDDAWCLFYRVKGYHLQREKQQARADAARQKALDLALKMMADPGHEGRRKELLVITAAMRHYLRDDPAALADLRAAAPLKFHLPKLEKERNEGFDAYLSELIKEHISALEEGRSTDEPEKITLRPSRTNRSVTDYKKMPAGRSALHSRRDIDPHPRKS